MAWIRREDLEGLQAYTRLLGDDLKKRAAWCDWMLEHLWDRDDWESVRDEFDAAWSVRQELERQKGFRRVVEVDSHLNKFGESIQVMMQAVAMSDSDITKQAQKVREAFDRTTREQALQAAKRQGK